MMHQAWIEVDLDALRHNVGTLKRTADPTTLVMPVIKANAYGHGIVAVAQALGGRDDTWGFAVARGEEALLLRSLGVGDPILTLGVPPVAGIVDLAKQGITAPLAELANPPRNRLSIHPISCGDRGLGHPIHHCVDCTSAQICGKMHSIAHG